MTEELLNDTVTSCPASALMDSVANSNASLLTVMSSETPPADPAEGAPVVASTTGYVEAPGLVSGVVPLPVTMKSPNMLLLWPGKVQTN